MTNPGANPGAAVHLIGLTKRYGKVRAVDGIDLMIAPGRCCRQARCATT